MLKIFGTTINRSVLVHQLVNLPDMFRIIMESYEHNVVNSQPTQLKKKFIVVDKDAAPTPKTENKEEN